MEQPKALQDRIADLERSNTYLAVLYAGIGGGLLQASFHYYLHFYRALAAQTHPGA